MALQPGQLGMKALGSATWPHPARGLAAHRPPAGDPDEHRPRERRTAVRTAVVWDVLRRCSAAPGRPDRRRRRRHRRVRGPARRARPPGHRGRPQPRRAGRAAAPGRRGRRPRSPASRATWPGCSTGRRGPAAPTWCSATACSSTSTTRPPRWPRSPGCCAPAAPFSLLVASRHAAVVARAVAGQFARPRRARRHWRRPARAERRFTAPRGHRPARRQPASPRRRCTACGCSPTSSPAPWSTSSPARPTPCSTWSAPRRPPRVPRPRHPAARARHAAEAGRSNSSIPWDFSP